MSPAKQGCSSKVCISGILFRAFNESDNLAGLGVVPRYCTKRGGRVHTVCSYEGRRDNFRNPSSCIRFILLLPAFDGRRQTSNAAEVKLRYSEGLLTPRCVVAVYYNLLCVATIVSNRVWLGKARGSSVLH